MTIDKAIEVLSHLNTDPDAYFFTDLKDAIKLGINALIFYRKLISSNTGEIQGNFLGETDD